MAGFSLSKLKEKAMPAEVKFAGERLKFKYTPRNMTQDWYEKFEDAQEDENIEAMAGCLADVIVEWDLTDEQDAVVAPEKDAIMKADLPLPLFGLLNDAIHTDVSGGNEEGKKGRSKR